LDKGNKDKKEVKGVKMMIFDLFFQARLTLRRSVVIKNEFFQKLKTALGTSICMEEMI
jgi:hypothetical protein